MSESRWNEFEDKEIVDYKRVRSAIEHEDGLTNHRLTWLLTSQGFLFAAFCLLFSASTKTDVKEELRPYYQPVLASLAMIGMLCGLFFSRALRAAELHLKVIRRWWKERPETNMTRHPQIAGTPSNVLDQHLPASLLSLIFAGGWFFLLVTTSLRELLFGHIVAIGEASVVLATASSLVFIGWSLRGRRSDRAVQKPAPNHAATGV